MTKKAKFIEFVNENLFCNLDISVIDQDVAQYWEALQQGRGNKKVSEFTDNGRLVLKYLQSLPEGTPAMKSKDIADAIGISSRSVAGTMRKLCTDMYVEKLGEDPCLYCVTEKGKNIKFED